MVYCRFIERHETTVSKSGISRIKDEIPEIFGTVVSSDRFILYMVGCLCIRDLHLSVFMKRSKVIDPLVHLCTVHCHFVLIIYFFTNLASQILSHQGVNY